MRERYDEVQIVAAMKLQIKQLQLRLCLQLAAILNQLPTPGTCISFKIVYSTQQKIANRIYPDSLFKSSLTPWRLICFCGCHEPQQHQPTTATRVTAATISSAPFNKRLVCACAFFSSFSSISSFTLAPRDPFPVPRNWCCCYCVMGKSVRTEPYPILQTRHASALHLHIFACIWTLNSCGWMNVAATNTTTTTFVLKVETAIATAQRQQQQQHQQQLWHSHKNGNATTVTKLYFASINTFELDKSQSTHTYTHTITLTQTHTPGSDGG